MRRGNALLSREKASHRHGAQVGNHAEARVADDEAPAQATGGERAAATASLELSEHVPREADGGRYPRSRYERSTVAGMRLEAACDNDNSLVAGRGT